VQLYLLPSALRSPRSRILDAGHFLSQRVPHGHPLGGMTPLPCRWQLSQLYILWGFWQLGCSPLALRIYGVHLWFGREDLVEDFVVRSTFMSTAMVRGRVEKRWKPCQGSRGEKFGSCGHVHAVPGTCIPGATVYVHSCCVLREVLCSCAGHTPFVGKCPWYTSALRAPVSHQPR
jgi:hypothetical protein